MDEYGELLGLGIDLGGFVVEDADSSGLQRAVAELTDTEHLMRLLPRNVSFIGRYIEPSLGDDDVLVSETTDGSPGGGSGPWVILRIEDAAAFRGRVRKLIARDVWLRHRRGR